MVRGTLEAAPDTRIDRKGEARDHREGPRPGRPGQPGPGRGKERERARRDEASSQIVEDLPSADQGETIPLETVSRRHPGDEPRDDLPVAANPSALAPRVGR